MLCMCFTHSLTGGGIVNECCHSYNLNKVGFTTTCLEWSLHLLCRHMFFHSLCDFSKP